MHEKRHFLSYQKCRHYAQITWPYAYYVTLGSRCKMANLSSEDETDTLPERPGKIHPYQFEPVRQDFERVPEHRVSFEANPMQYSTNSTQMGVMWHSKNVSSFELYNFNPLSPHCGSIVRDLVHCYSWGRLWIVTVRGNTVGQQVNFFVDHTHTQITEESKMATVLTPQTDITSRKVTWLMENPRLLSRPAYRKLNRLKTQLNIYFYLIKSETSDSFVNHCDGHFAYLKTLDFYFKDHFWGGLERGVF